MYTKKFSDKDLISLAWFEQSCQDFIAAEWLMRGKIFEYVCFFCSQSAEKALKGFLFYKQCKGTKRHNLAMLLHCAEKFNKELKNLSRHIQRLNGYYLYTRYPLFDHNTLLGHEIFNTRKEAINAITSSKIVLDRIISLLSKELASKVEEFYIESVRKTNLSRSLFNEK